MTLPRFGFRALPISPTEDQILNELRYRAAVERAFVAGDDALTQIEKALRAGGGGGGAETSVGATPPANPKPGQLWFKNVDPVGLYIWYTDADSSQWVQVSGSPPAPPPTSGEQTINPVGLTEAVFNPIPREANSFVVSLQNVQMNGTGVNLQMDFVGDTGNNFGVARHVMGAAYAAPVAFATSPLVFDEVGSGGLQGNYYFERQLATAIDVWVMTGNHRRGGVTMVHNSGRLILSIPETRLRFRPTGGNTFASNPISVKWRL